MKQTFRVQLKLAIGLLMLVPVLCFSQSRSGQASNPNARPNVQSDMNQPKNNPMIQQKRTDSNVKQEGLNKSRPQVLQSSFQKDQASRTQKNQSRVVRKGVREVTVIDLPGYPKYVHTGNPSLDEKNYQNAKTEWISNNKEAYENYLKSQGARSGVRIPRSSSQTKN